MFRNHKFFMMAAGNVSLFVPNIMQWKLDDNSSDVIVAGPINGVLSGGNTADLHATINGKSVLHLDGATQYITIPVPKIWPNQMLNLWPKYAGNPVNTQATFGCLSDNPGGGWYFYGDNSNEIYRWSSNDLLTWTNKIKVLSKGVEGNFDATAIASATIFRKPDGTWILLYRGANSVGALNVGLAISNDGLNFVKKDNGGVNDGLFAQFGSNYDVAEVLLVGTTYYAYSNGSPNHGVMNIYVSTDDFQTFTPSPYSPDFGKGRIQEFCPGIFKYSGYYYALVSRDIVQVGAELYDHAVGLYRSTSPLFEYGVTDFLGYAIINDQTYDVGYIDDCSFPVDIYGNILPGFENFIPMFYSGKSNVGGYSQNIATVDITSLSSLTRCLSNLHFLPNTVSFNVQFDTLTANDVVLFIGNTPSDTTGSYLLKISTSGPNKVFSIFLNASYNLTTVPLAINTPYKVVVTEDGTNVSIYVNNVLAGSWVGSNNGNRSNIYIGTGYNNEFLDGYIWDFRIYPYALSDSERTSLYLHG